MKSFTLLALVCAASAVKLNDAESPVAKPFTYTEASPLSAGFVQT